MFIMLEFRTIFGIKFNVMSRKARTFTFLMYLDREELIMLLSKNTPALFTRISTVGTLFKTFATKDPTSSFLLKSWVKQTRRFRRLGDTDFINPASFPLLSPHATTVAPSLIKRVAMLLPIPLLAPVTTATLFLSLTGVLGGFSNYFDLG